MYQLHLCNENVGEEVIAESGITTTRRLSSAGVIMTPRSPPRKSNSPQLALAAPRRSPGTTPAADQAPEQLTVPPPPRHGADSPEARP